jgi:hypothetical protein
MGGFVTEEQAIIHDQYLDLVYSHSGIIYNLIPHTPLSLNDLSTPTLESHADGVVGSVTNTKTVSSPVETSEVNVVHSTSYQQPGGKKKNKGKSKKYSNQ